MQFLDLFAKYAAPLALVATAIWTVMQYAISKRGETRKNEFENYHNLVKQLVDSETPEGVTRIDRQIAIIFELKHFPRYYPVTRRILLGLKLAWPPVNPGFIRLNKEMDITIETINKYYKRRITFRRVDNQ